jgi:hypothetical protein
MSFKLISIVFIPLAITHQILCGQNVTHHIHISPQTYRARSVVTILAVRFLRASHLSILYPPTRCFLIRSTLCTLLFLLSFLFTLVAFNIRLRFDTTTGPCFAFLFSKPAYISYILNFQIDHTYHCEHCFESESSELNTIIDMTMICDYPSMIAGII